MLQYPVPVVSAIRAMDAVTIPVVARSWRQAVRVACHVAQSLHRIPAPMVPVDEHDLAVRMWHEALAAHPLNMGSLNGGGKPFWRLPEDSRYGQ